MKKEEGSVKEEELISLYEDLLERTVGKMKRYFGENLVSVVLFGSLARGAVKNDSDIDLLVVFEDLPRERLKRQDIFMTMEREAEVDEEIERIYEQSGCYPYISPILKTREEAKILSPLYLDMVTDARILFDKADFFNGVLERLRRELELLNAKKKKVGKKWYWDLKPDYTFGEVIRIE